MKKIIVTLSALFIVSCSKKDTGDTDSPIGTMDTDTMAAIPNPSPSTDTTSVTMADSASTSPTTRRDSAR